ncbi:MAG: ATP-binding protein [Bacteroidales bacterium]|nr:ATP-binding protein [Bacteroidales bacterium]
MIHRVQEELIEKKLSSGKAIILLGPRQTGKTTLMEKIISKLENPLVLNCDDPFIRSQLSGSNTAQLRQIIGSHKVVFVDEAQRVKNIGITLKLITDQMKDVLLLVSGSSSLEIANEINEPLTGRKFEFMLYPVSWQEFHRHAGHISAMQQLEMRLVYGMYPEVIGHPGDEKDILREITGSYLYKDLLSWKGIRKPEILDKLLKALALQIGNLVSYNELANTIQADKNTISNYIDLLEKAFVVFKLQPFTRNQRNEISSGRKIYFYDTGIRNALINNFNLLESRSDTGALWENFMVAERMKFLHYSRQYAGTWFWRNHQQKEIDYIEEADGKISAFEFKWNPGKKFKVPSSFAENYTISDVEVVSRGNFLPFVGVT